MAPTAPRPSMAKRLDGFRQARQRKPSSLLLRVVGKTPEDEEPRDRRLSFSHGKITKDICILSGKRPTKHLPIPPRERSRSQPVPWPASARSGESSKTAAKAVASQGDMIRKTIAAATRCDDAFENDYVDQLDNLSQVVAWALQSQPQAC